MATGTATANDEKLQTCPSSPNCVCSDDTSDSHAIEPFRFSGEAAAAWAALRAALLEEPRTRISKESDDYLHAEARSALFRFVDDLEFSLRSEEGLIAVRSASRVGYSDLGVNRRRIERLREVLQRQKILE